MHSTNERTLRKMGLHRRLQVSVARLGDGHDGCATHERSSLTPACSTRRSSLVGPACRPVAPREDIGAVGEEGQDASLSGGRPTSRKPAAEPERAR